MWTVSRTSLKEICYDHMVEAWNQASDDGRLPTHWRQVFYVMRPICDDHPDSDRPLRDTTFKQILEAYLEDYCTRVGTCCAAPAACSRSRTPPRTTTACAMSTMNVRRYLAAPGRRRRRVEHVAQRFPTEGADEPDRRRADPFASTSPPCTASSAAPDVPTD